MLKAKGRRELGDQEKAGCSRLEGAGKVSIASQQAGTQHAPFSWEVIAVHLWDLCARQSMSPVLCDCGSGREKGHSQPKPLWTPRPSLMCHLEGSGPRDTVLISRQGSAVLKVRRALLKVTAEPGPYPRSCPLSPPVVLLLVHQQARL